MAGKRRVKAPKQRQAAPVHDSGRRRQLLAALGGLVAALILGGAFFFALGQGASGPDVETVRTALQAAGCTLESEEALSGQHTIREPGDTSDGWNTDPPTTGPHYAVAAVFNRYGEELELARVVHNLEHGGVFVLYGKDVPDETVEQLGAFYDDHKTGTIMAPLDRLGDDFALGAWVAHGDPAMGYLAKCKAFDENAVSSFFSAFQFKGPEHFDPSELRPGH